MSDNEKSDEARDRILEDMGARVSVNENNAVDWTSEPLSDGVSLSDSVTVTVIRANGTVE